jgi:hypothetical protein
MSTDTLVVLAIMAALFGGWFYLLAQANELFVVGVKDGVPTLKRGNIPGRLLSDLKDICKKARLDGVTLRATVENGKPMLRATGPVPEDVLQRMRNVLGMWTKQQIRSGAKKT